MFIPKSVVSLRNYSRATFFQDLTAGLTVGVVALPLAMAFAIASGVSPERGIFTAIVAGFLVSLLGGSRTQIGGPTGAFVVIVSGIVASHGYSGLVLCTLMAGVMLMIMGFSRLGAIIKFIPFPVVTGFTAGIAVVIFSTQMRDFFGLKLQDTPPEFIPQWIAYAKAAGSFSPAATALGVGTVVIILGLRRVAQRIPGMLVAMVVAALLTRYLALPVETIGSRFGDLPRSLPAPALPPVSLQLVRDLMPSAITVTLLAAIESLLSATVADGMTGNRHKSNMELVGQGVANIASGLLGGIPATGAIARTATNIKSGGKTPVAGMIHAVTLLLILMFAAPLAKEIPLACLAGILVVVAWQMSQVQHFRQLLSAPKADVVVLVLTFLLTILIDLTVAVQVGVVLAAMLFIKRMAEVTNIAVVTRELQDQEETPDSQSVVHRSIPAGVEVYEINGPFFFGAAEKFSDTLRLVGSAPAVLILRMRNVPAIDATGLNALSELSHRSKKDGTVLLLSDVPSPLLAVLKRSHLWPKLGPDHTFATLDAALARARQILDTDRPT